MNLTFIECQPQRVLAAFRQGDFDNLEVIGQADERDFFQRCFQERLLTALADSMPTARKKEEVPRWFILAACLSLKLHQENSFLAFERVVLRGKKPPDNSQPGMKTALTRKRFYNYYLQSHQNVVMWIVCGAHAPVL
jgi:hypothetical protein